MCACDGHRLLEVTLDYYRLHLPDFPELNPSASYRNYILNIFEYDVWTLIGFHQFEVYIL